MLIIAKSTTDHMAFIIDSNTYQIIGAGPYEDCVINRDYMVFHDFWFSVKDSHGRTLTPNPTYHYKTVFRPNYSDPTPYDGVASGWWEIAPYTALDMQHPHDYIRFDQCARAS